MKMQKLGKSLVNSQDLTVFYKFWHGFDMTFQLLVSSEKGAMFYSLNTFNES